MTETVAPEANMSEQTQPPIDETMINGWMAASDQFFDKPYTIDRGNGQEEVFLYDAIRVQERDTAGNKTGNTHPEVVIFDANGVREEVATSEFLNWRGVTPDALQAEIDATKSPEPEAQQTLPEEPKAGFLELAKVAIEQEPSPAEQRAKQLFAPIDTAKEQVDNYDDLFSDDYKGGTTEQAAVRNQRVEMTPKTQDEAAERLQVALQKDSVLSSIFSEYQRNKGSLMGVKFLGDALREDRQLRLEVGTYLLGKVDRMAYDYDMPERVRDNTEKGPNAPGYDHIKRLSSREYAALLALAMIDGTFDANRSPSDRIDYHPDTGVAIRGQHRAAAQKILN